MKVFLVLSGRVAGKDCGLFFPEPSSIEVYKTNLHKKSVHCNFNSDSMLKGEGDSISDSVPSHSPW